MLQWRMRCLGLAALLGGCMSGGDPALGVTAQASEVEGGCDDFYCGTNSPIVGSVPFWELDATGAEANSAGLRVVPDSFQDARGNAMQIVIDRDVLRGKRGTGDVVADKKLIGSTLRLISAADNRAYHLKIVDVGTTSFRITPPTDRRVQTYHFVYYRDDAPAKISDLCPATTDPDWVTISGQAVIYRGDRFDRVAKTVTEVGFDTGWFNVACAGTVTAKLHLMAHTLASEDGAHHTTVAQRQTVLKMFTADYCGRGTPFTVSGRPIRFRWQQPWQEEHGFDESHVLIESVWTEHGAACLSIYRMQLAPPPLPYGTVTAPDIAAECDPVGRTLPPWCDGPYVDWESHGYLISGNP